MYYSCFQVEGRHFVFLCTFRTSHFTTFSDTSGTFHSPHTLETTRLKLKVGLIVVFHLHSLCTREADTIFFFTSLMKCVPRRGKEGVASYWRSFQTVGHMMKIDPPDFAPQVHLEASPIIFFRIHVVNAITKKLVRYTYGCTSHQS